MGAREAGTHPYQSFHDGGCASSLVRNPPRIRHLATRLDVEGRLRKRHIAFCRATERIDRPLPVVEHGEDRYADHASRRVALEHIAGALEGWVRSEVEIAIV